MAGVPCSLGNEGMQSLVRRKILHDLVQSVVAILAQELVGVSRAQQKWSNEIVTLLKISKNVHVSYVEITKSISK